jgi:hypothetical protein
MRVAGRHEQPGDAVGDELRGAADGRCHHGSPVRERLEHDEREPLGPRGQRHDVELAKDGVRIVPVAREDDAVADAELLRLALEPFGVGASLLEVAADEHESSLRQLRQRRDQLALSLHIAEARDLPDERGTVRDAELRAQAVAVGGGKRGDVETVVDDLEPPDGIALAHESAARVLGDGDDPGAKPRGRVVEGAVDGRPPRGRREVVLDVHVRDDRDARGARRRPSERVRRDPRVRVQHVGAA